MSDTDKRLKRLEKRAPVKRTFVEWLGDPWTPEEKAEAIRREPDRLFFWRSLLDHPACRAAAEHCPPEAGPR